MCYAAVPLMLDRSETIICVEVEEVYITKEQDVAMNGAKPLGLQKFSAFSVRRLASRRT